MLNITTYYPEFITSTILEWKMLLKPAKYKHFITDAYHT